MARWMLFVPAVCLMLLTAFQTGVQAQEKIRPLFRAREVVTGRLTDRETQRISALSQEKLVQHRTAFDRIRIDRSLMLHKCGNWCGSQALGFERIMQQAAESMHAKQSGGIQGLRGGICGTGLFEEFCGAWPSNGQAPLHLLAVVNRLDLARWAEGFWQGAEIRFVYGYKKVGVSSPPDMTLIVEWRYKALAWDKLQVLATEWNKLSDPSFPGDITTILPALKVGAPAFDLIRVRTNSSPNSAQGWTMYQWTLSQSGSWGRARLDDELDPVCYRDSSGHCAELFTYWAELEADPNLNRRSIPQLSPLLPSYKNYGNALPPMPQLIGKTEMRPRYILSLQQCSQCHFPETKTEFMHIANRQPGAPTAKLSKFLTGGNPDAGYDQLGPASSALKHVVNVTVDTGCTEQPCPTVNITRTFHDLGRRRLFLAAVLIAGPVFNDEDRKLIEDYAVDFSH